MMLYNFEELNRKLDQLGFPEIIGASGFQVIRGVDFEKAYKSGSISFEDDGIFLEYQGKKHRGYMFIKEAFITYQTPIKFPKFHLLKCRTIQEFVSRGNFQHRYEWSNSNVNSLLDKQTRMQYNDINLELCSYCKSAFFEKIKDTQDFFDSLDISEIAEKKIEVDIFGYVKGKEKISKAFREKHNFTCESCSIKLKNNQHKRWWHTHHIDGEKTNNNIQNLRCLCILCHANVDNRHKENFSKGAIPKQIESFKKAYREELLELNNTYF
jgi:hypothetical protein